MKNVPKIINQWDPIDLFPFAPKDEYSSEIAAIERESVLVEGTEELATIIYNVFFESFGDTFDKKYEECYEIACKILG